MKYILRKSAQHDRNLFEGRNKNQQRKKKKKHQTTYRDGHISVRVD